MAEHTHSITSHVSAETVWNFVRDMDQWAPFLLGYQKHHKQSERESLWTLKGDVGALSRSVEFRVHITEWAEPERVRFTLEALNEALAGDGSFRIEKLDPALSDASATRTEAPTQGFLLRLWTRLVRRLLGRRQVERRVPSAPPAVRLSFRLRLTPSGPMAPMLEAMIQPLMVATAEDLAQRIVVHLEDRS